jgi:ADP-heptose:LPS heptosyltransferase
VTRRLVARLDNIGDVLLAGPAVRAVAASGDGVVMLAGPSGAQMASLLPGVSEVIVFDAPWVSFDPPTFDRAATERLVAAVEDAAIDEAVILTSFHQSPLPLALLLRMAGVEVIAATSVDYAGELLDIRHPYLDDLHEVEQHLSLCSAAGHRLPIDDHGELRVRGGAATLDGSGWTAQGSEGGVRERYVVIHPGASVPSRGLPPTVVSHVVDALAAAGRHVVITGSAEERPLADRLLSAAPDGAVTDLVGLTDLAELVDVVAGADVVVCGNTGIAHVAAAVATPVVEAFAPTVPAHRWRPWMVPHVLLGRFDIECAGCRSRTCPLPGQPCLEPFTAPAVLDAIARLDPVGAGAVSRIGGGA